VALEPGQEILDHRDRDVTEDQALPGVLLRLSSEAVTPVLGDKIEVPGVHFRIGRDDVALPQSPAEGLFDRDLLTRPHLIGGGDKQAVRMRADIETEINRLQTVAPHPLDLLREFLGCFGDMGIPVDGVAREMDAAEILEARPVAEPAAHLHERIVHLGVAIHVADGQALDGQAARQTETADGDRRKANALLLVPGVVEHLVALAVDDVEMEVVEHAVERGLDLAPREACIGIFGVERMFQTLHVHVRRGD
jgi:hypothetical protein